MHAVVTRFENNAGERELGHISFENEEIKQRKEASHEAISALWTRAALGYVWMHSSHLNTWIPLHFFLFSIKWNNLAYEHMSYPKLQRFSWWEVLVVYCFSFSSF